MSDVNDAAWGTVWLYGNWWFLTKSMPTEEREHAADCVARWLKASNDHDPVEEVEATIRRLRWWR